MHDGDAPHTVVCGLADRVRGSRGTLPGPRHAWRWPHAPQGRRGPGGSGWTC